VNTVMNLYSSKKALEFLDRVRDYRLLKDCSPCGWLIEYNRDILKKTVVAQIVKKVAAFYATQRFIIVLVRNGAVGKSCLQTQEQRGNWVICDNFGLLGSNAVRTCRYIAVFRRNILPPSSGLTSVRRQFLNAD
jgi:hypothetical protein